MKKLALALVLWLISVPAFAGVSCTLPYNLQNGTTADATQVMANYNALVSCLGNAAHAGANTDITSLNGLTTPIPPSEGGTPTFLGGTSSGSSNAYVITSTVPSNFSLTANYAIVFIANFTNTGAATLAVNGLTATNIYKQTINGPVALTGGEIVSGQLVVGWYDGTQFEILPPFSINAGNIVPSTISSVGAPLNFNLSASTASNQLTIAALTQNGQTPSTSNPVWIGFNSSGSNIVAEIATQTQFTLNSTSSQGCLTGVLCRLWVDLICQTISSSSCTSALIGVSVQSTPSDPSTSSPACKALAENNLQSTGSGTGGGTALYTIQTSVASLINVPIRVVGYVEATWTSGVGWGNPSKVALHSPGLPMPCSVIDELPIAQTQTQTTVTGTTPTTAGATASITPISAADLVEIEVDGFLESPATSGQYCVISLYRGSASTLIGLQPNYNSSLTNGVPVHLKWLDAPESSGSVTYGTAIYNSSSVSCIYPVNYSGQAGKGGGQIYLKEIMG